MSRRKTTVAIAVATGLETEKRGEQESERKVSNNDSPVCPHAFILITSFRQQQ